MAQGDSEETMIMDGSASPSLLSGGRGLYYQEETESQSSGPVSLSQDQPSVSGGCHGNEDVVLCEGSSLLFWIQKEQKNVEDQLSTLSVSVLQKKLEDIEISLKQVSISNQKERQGLASSLRQTTSSNTNPGDIKEKLIDLTKRQKTLLSCFKKQTELMKLVEQIKSTVNATDTAVAMETDNPVTEENPFVTKGTDLAVETGVPSLMSVLPEEPTPVPGTGPIPIVIIPNENRLIPPSSLSLLSQSQSDTVLCSTSDNNETPFSNTHRVSVYKQKMEQGATNISNYSSQPVVLAGSNPLEPAATTNTTTEQLPTTQPSFDLDHFLKNCLVIPHQLPKQSTSLSLPKDFWSSWSFDSLSLSPAYKHIEDELTNWS